MISILFPDHLIFKTIFTIKHIINVKILKIKID